VLQILAATICLVLWILPLPGSSAPKIVAARICG
jgi:hypothetical protein